MKSKLNIFYISAEVFPFTQAGGTGHVAGALPKYLKILGHDIRVMMPNYRLVNERKYVLRDVIRLQGLNIKVGDKVYTASAKSAFIPDSKVQIYFLDNKFFFDRNGICHDNQTGKEFKDNAERYIFFSKGCLETLKLLHWQPDIIHCNDWQTAIIPILLKSVYRDDEFFKNTKTLLSVHDFSKQGSFGASVFEAAGIPATLLNGKKSKGHFNFLEAGLEHADLLSTVSQSYANEIQENKEHRYGFGSILQKRKNEIVGILNGIDEVVWNPEKDNSIPFNYTRNDLSGKCKNKECLLDRFGLDANEKTPVISVVSSLIEEKGIDLVIAIMDQLLALDLVLIVSGKGESRFHKMLTAFQKKYPKKLGLDLEFNPDLAHLIAAGSDFCLMPSRFEPCGLNQLYSLAYGTIPIVRSTGGLADTVEEFDVESNTGTGFIFRKLDSLELFQVIKRAVKVYQNKEKWSRLIQNAMKRNFSWTSSARKYVKLYQKLVNTKISSK